MTLLVAARAVADLAAMSLLGSLAIRQYAGPVGQQRAVALGRWLGLVWALAAGAGLVATSAQRSGITLWQVDLAAVAAEVRFAPGAAVACAVGLALTATGGRGRAAIPLAAVGVAAAPATGHLGLGAIGAAAVTVHVLTAAWWFGSLAAMPVLLRGRREWAACLAAFSAWAPAAVALLGASGVAAALIRSPALDSAAAALLAAGWWQRRTTVRRASVQTTVRTRRAIAAEASGLAVVTVLAAALAYAR